MQEDKTATQRPHKANVHRPLRALQGHVSWTRRVLRAPSVQTKPVGVEISEAPQGHVPGREV